MQVLSLLKGPAADDTAIALHLKGHAPLGTVIRVPIAELIISIVL